MNSVQATVCFRPSGRIIPCVIRPQMLQLHHPPSQLCFINLRVNALNTSCLKLNPVALKSQRFKPLQKCNRNIATMSSQKTPVCLLGGEDKLAGEGEGSPGKGMGSINKGPSIEDVLRKQILMGEFYEDLSGIDEEPGGRDGSRGRGGGGGGGGSGGRSGDEGSASAPDEPLQAVLATFAFIFLYMFIITGDEYIRLAKDYFRYLLGGDKSVRLRRFLEKWENFLDTLTEKLVKEDEDDKHHLLVKAIVNTTTFYDSPEKYREMMGGSKSVSRGENDDSDEHSDSDEQRPDSDEGYDF